jgi:hypothetical protein
MRFVVPGEQLRKIRENDPEKTMDRGISAHEAVTNAFRNGLFSLSEIAFDSEHRRALVSYRFWCGMLCGSGRTVVLEKIGNEWRRTKLECGGWVS